MIFVAVNAGEDSVAIFERNERVRREKFRFWLAQTWQPPLPRPKGVTVPTREEEGIWNGDGDLVTADSTPLDPPSDHAAIAIDGTSHLTNTD